MPLKITRGVEPIRVERLNLCLYGQPGSGKTSLAFTADKPLLLDFDRGAHRAANRQDIVQVESWNDVDNITEADLTDYSTVIVDTAGRALDVLTVDIIRGNPKLGRGGALTLQGYGELKARFTAFMKQLNSFGKDVVLIAHMDEKRDGDDVIERLDVQGGSRGEIYKAADAMGRVTVKASGRELNFNPTEAAFGKNPGQMDPLPIPRPEVEPHFLAGVINGIKDRLNTLTEDQIEAQTVLEKWRLALNDVEDADGVNKLIPEATAAGPVIKALLHDRALKLGLTPDKRTRTYTAPKANQSKAA